MRRLLLYACLVGLIAAPPAARADDPKIAYQHFELANGMRVFLVEDHRAPMVYEVMWINAGSKDEAPHRSGFAHLFEHLMFKGSTHLPDGLMDRLLEEAGGLSNAFTSNDMTVYQNSAGANFLEPMLWIEADRLAGLTDTLDQAKLDNQRDVVLNERRQRVDNQPYGQAQPLISRALWPEGHGYHWPVIGEIEDLRAAALADVRAFFQTYYVPNNLTMVIAGDFAPAEARRLVEKYFAWIPRAPEPRRPQYKTPPPITKPIVLDATDKVAVPRIYLAWRGPAQFAADEPALTLAADVLAGGKSSRLHKRLVHDQKIAQDVFGYFSADTLGGTFQIIATAKPGVEPRRLVQEISDEIAALAAAPPDPAELERARNLHEMQMLSRLESTLARAIQLAGYDVQARDAAYFGKDLARFRAVTAAQVRTAAATYLPATARVELTVRPAAPSPAAPSPAAAKEVKP